LLENGGNADADDEDKNTALHKVAYNGHLSCAKLLLAYSSDASLVNIIGETAKQVAIEKGHSQIAILCEKSEKAHKDGVLIKKISMDLDINDIHSVVFFNDSKSLDNLLQVGNSIFSKLSDKGFC